MVNKNELRIGNWVASTEDCEKYNSQILVVSLGIDDIGLLAPEDKSGELITFEWSYDQIYPIPLTPTILIKTGFIRHDKKWETKQTSFICIQENGILVNDKPDGDIKYIVYKSAAGAINEVKYLHQLQNLYYSIFGEELLFEAQCAGG